MDFYRHAINNAKRTWLECRFYHKWHHNLRKDHRVTRLLKRSAKNQERKDRAND